MCAGTSSVWDCISAPNARGHLDQIPARVRTAFSSNSELQTTEQTQSSKGMSFFLFPYLVFRRSSIFLQRLERVNNQEHAAGGAGKGPENMGVRQGNGQMLARVPMCRGGQWGPLPPHRDSELPQWAGRSPGLGAPAGLGEPPRPVQGLAETCHSTRTDAGGSPHL